jgi:hypothetical protein
MKIYKRGADRVSCQGAIPQFSKSFLIRHPITLQHPKAAIPPPIRLPTDKFYILRSADFQPCSQFSNGNGTAYQALNIVDDSPFSYEKFWPELARWFGIDYGKPEADESKFQVISMPRDPAPRGFGPPGKVYLKWTFSEWATTSEVKEAWEKVQEREGLRVDLDPWRSREKMQEVWATLDAEILGRWGRTQTMDKAKKLGWMGHVQTDEGIRDTVEKMVGMKMVPKF